MYCLLCKRFLFPIRADVEVIIQERKIKIKVQWGKTRDICATQVNLACARPEHVSECYFSIRGLFNKYLDWNCSGCSLGGMCLQPVLTCSYVSYQLMTQVASGCVCSVGCSRSRK
jgi:hypothetical protein